MGIGATLRNGKTIGYRGKSPTSIVTTKTSFTISDDEDDKIRDDKISYMSSLFNDLPPVVPSTKSPPFSRYLFVDQGYRVGYVRIHITFKLDIVKSNLLL